MVSLVLQMLNPHEMIMIIRIKITVTVKINVIKYYL